MNNGDEDTNARKHPFTQVVSGGAWFRQNEAAYGV